MHVQNQVAAKYYNSALTKRNSAVGQAENFADRLTTQSKEHSTAAPINPAQHTSPSSVSSQDITPADLYEQMTMKSTANPQSTNQTGQTSKVVSGVNWTDETLALLTGAKYGVEIDTTKTINWNATGDQALTEEQLQELRSKYNLEDLSPQDYYDLMSDLTNMNAISAEDIHGMHLKTAPPAGMYGGFSGFGGKSFTSGNIFDAIKDDLSSLAGLNDFMISDDFWLLNPNANQEHYRGYLDYIQSRTNSMNKLNQIFSDIRG